MERRYNIVATVIATGERFWCFSWTRSPEEGIRRAEATAIQFGWKGLLKDYRAEEIVERVS